MSDAGRVKVDRRTYASVYDRFRDWVAGDTDTRTSSIGYEVERAMLEFMDEDELTQIEESLAPLFEAAGLSRGAAQKKNPTGRAAAGGQTKPVFARVDPEVKEAFELFIVDEDMKFRDALAAALRDRMDGGRQAFLLDRIEQVVPDAEAALATVEGDTGGLTKSQRLEIGIANDLDEQFSNGELREAIDRHTSGTDYYQETYAPRVIERKDVVRHPAHEDVDLKKNPDATVAYMPESRAKEIRVKNIIDLLPGPDGMARPFTKRDYARAAARELGVSMTDYDTTNRYVTPVLDDLGFEWDESREKFVPADGEADDDTDAEAESDSAESGVESVAAEVDAELDRLQGASRAVTDGGTTTDPGG